MIKTKREFVLKTLIAIFLSSFFVFNAFSLIYHNGSGGGYGGSGGGGGDKSSSIEAFIIEGAGCFLDGYADVLTLLNRIETAELKGMDYNDLQEIVDRALTNLFKTRTIYSQLIASAENTPYNEAVIEKLISFDYELFMENNDLIPAVFKEAAGYLKKGDITGTFKKSFANFANITAILNTIKEEIAVGNMPQVSGLWKLNQVYAGELLFGQYTAQVFHAL